MFLRAGPTQCRPYQHKAACVHVRGKAAAPLHMSLRSTVMQSGRVHCTAAACYMHTDARCRSFARLFFPSLAPGLVPVDGVVGHGVQLLPQRLSEGGGLARAAPAVHVRHGQVDLQARQKQRHMSTRRAQQACRAPGRCMTQPCGPARIDAKQGGSLELDPSSAPHKPDQALA